MAERAAGMTNCTSNKAPSGRVDLRQNPFYGALSHVTPARAPALLCSVRFGDLWLDSVGGEGVVTVEEVAAGPGEVGAALPAASGGRQAAVRWPGPGGGARSVPRR